MDLLQSLLNLVVPPSGLVLLLLTWPVLAFINFWRWVLSHVFAENVQGKVVVITGASSGIGEQMVYEYAKRGAKLMITARRENMLKEVAEHARAQGAADVHVVAADVSHEEECKKIVDETMNTFGRIDHLVVNHGVAAGFFVEEAQSVDLFRQVMDINVLGGIYITYFALPHLRKTRGKLVVTASTASWLTIPRMAIYCASKAAVLTFFDTLRNEVGSALSSVTIAMPGYIQSEMTMGKFLSADGRLDMDTDMRDTLVGPSPVASTGYCAKEIVQSALRGERYTVVPAWYKVSLPFRIFAPQLLDAVVRVLFVKEPQPGKSTTKVIMDTLPGMEKIVYPPGMQQKTETKTE